jgi:hypothetical protein
MRFAAVVAFAFLLKVLALTAETDQQSLFPRHAVEVVHNGAAEMT